MTDRVTGGLLLIGTLIYGYMAMKFEVGFMADPIGPKAFPLILAGLMIFISLYLLIRPDPEPAWPGAKVWISNALVIVSLVIYAYALVPLGFLLATTLEITVLACIFQGKVFKGLAAAVAASLILYSLFVHILGIPLPTGKIFGG